NRVMSPFEEPRSSRRRVRRSPSASSRMAITLAALSSRLIASYISDSWVSEKRSWYCIRAPSLSGDRGAHRHRVKPWLPAAPASPRAALEHRQLEPVARDEHRLGGHP